MKEKRKDILSFVLMEAVLFSALVPFVDVFNNIKREGFRWALGYLFFFAAVFACMFIKKAAVFFPVWVVCTAADFALDKKSIILLAALPVAVWLLLNVIEPLNGGDFGSKERVKKAAIANAAFAAAWIIFFVMVLIVLKKTEGIEYIAKYYRAPWLALCLYYIYSLVFKSKIPAFIKLKTKLKKLC